MPSTTAPTKRMSAVGPGTLPRPKSAPRPKSMPPGGASKGPMVVDDTPIDPNLPAWKKAILQKKRDEKNAVAMDANAKFAEEKEKWDALPKWKQDMLRSKGKAPPGL